MYKKPYHESPEISQLNYKVIEDKKNEINKKKK